jgi:hypothetical protein
MDTKKLKEIIVNIGSKPLLASLLVFVLASIFVIGLTLVKYKYSEDFSKNILIEAHGMLFDILVIGIFIFALHKLGEKKIEIKRYKEEISDFRFWESDEAKFRIIGNIKRLNDNGITDIDLHNCYLEKVHIWKLQLQNADLRGANLQEALFLSVNFQGANMRTANLQGAALSHSNLHDTDLAYANLKEVDLEEVNLQGANLINTNLVKAKSLTIDQLAKVKSLYYAKIDPRVKVEIKIKYPHLLERPEEVDDKEEQMLREENV